MLGTTEPQSHPYPNLKINCAVEIYNTTTGRKSTYSPKDYVEYTY